MHQLKPGPQLLAVSPSVIALARALGEVDDRLDQERIWRVATHKEARAIQDQWAPKGVEIHIVALKRLAIAAKEERFHTS